MVELFADSGYSDQKPHSATSDLGLHCLPITLLGVSRLQWVKELEGVYVFILYNLLQTLHHGSETKCVVLEN